MVPTPLNPPKVFVRQISTDGEHDHRPFPVTVTTPGGFGGTRSTMVNAKLKDNIFSTVLKSVSEHYRVSTESSRKAPGSAVMSDSASTEKAPLPLKGRKWRVANEGQTADTEISFVFIAPPPLPSIR